MVSAIGSVNLTSVLLSSTNRTAKHRPDPEELFKKLDSNGDGKIDQSEMAAFQSETSSQTGGPTDLANALSGMDTDGNGALSQDEFTTGMQKFQTDMKAKGFGGSPPSPAEMFKKVDQNSDGSLDQSEMSSFLTDLSSKTGTTVDTATAFSQFDTNGDGKVSQTEFEVGMKKMHDEMETKTGDTQTSTDQTDVTQYLMDMSTMSSSAEAAKVGIYAQNSETVSALSLLDIKI